MTAKRLLVVDDDPDVIAFVQVALSGEGIRIDTAASGEEALARVDRVRPDSILLDVRLPGMDGLEVFEALRQGGLKAPVVMMTSYSSMDTVMKAVQGGAHDVITKPLRATRLVELVRSSLRERPHGGERPHAQPEPLGLSDEESEASLVGRSPAMVKVYKLVAKVAPSDTTVLITGESGTGKELVAQLIHHNGPGKPGPFLAINCAAIPATLLESELFGHERGAFTGAAARMVGKFERARGGTLFLDEIGQMPLELQGKILRALEQRTIERLGGHEEIFVDTRILAATNQDLRAAIDEGTFREDLYYRLAVVQIDLPPLRKRGNDIHLLTEYLVRRISERTGRRIERVHPGFMERLEAYDWPGNVRELRNVLERSVVLGRGPVLLPDDLPELAGEGPVEDATATLRRLYDQGVSLDELQARYLRVALQEEGGNITRTAEALGVHRNTLRRRLKESGDRPD